MNAFTSWTDPVLGLAAGAWGMLWGLANYRLLAGPLQRMRTATDREAIATLQQQVLGRFLLRMALSFVSLLMVFLVTGRPLAILAAVAGLILAGDAPLFFRMRARRERA
ncbi:hypothetical protein [Thermaerobacter subterraneus]|uniref:ATP synthase I chain n=1 Tax=Thermaerobacter subterraneus DSM 13965 TaxID=867903 RepID=K6QDC7_9FIRM|nr:hypothetical protein [Thermaerobacter subterraneus]EKP94666.1 hypothetical protein ThesuDRAFT_02407 [Thermaerobacter subterraneus DSM 13965]